MVAITDLCVCVCANVENCKFLLEKVLEVQANEMVMKNFLFVFLSQ